MSDGELVRRLLSRVEEHTQASALDCVSSSLDEADPSEAADRSMNEALKNTFGAIGDQILSLYWKQQYRGKLDKLVCKGFLKKPFPIITGRGTEYPFSPMLFTPLVLGEQLTELEVRGDIGWAFGIEEDYHHIPKSGRKVVLYRAVNDALTGITEHESFSAVWPYSDGNGFVSYDTEPTAAEYEYYLKTGSELPAFTDRENAAQALSLMVAQQTVPLISKGF